MKLNHKTIFALMLVAMVSVTGCSDDDDDPITPPIPEDPMVKTIVISPESATFTALGEDLQFEAVAFDATGAVIDTVFVWQSSQTSVVGVGSDGMATSVGVGTAEIYTTAGSVTDTASVTVNLSSGPLIEWVQSGGGDWANPDNWSGGVVPGEDDVAAITIEGTYTVSITGDVTVESLVLGNDTGIQTLDTSTHTLTFVTGGLQGGAELSIEGTVQILESVVWSGGTVIGDGLLKIESGAEMIAIGNPMELETDLLNNGTITLWQGTSLRVRRNLENKIGALVELQDDANLSVYGVGEFTNEGTVHKSEGEDEASFYATSGVFTSTGNINVSSGSLALSGGELRGAIDIAEGAILRQSSTTIIPIINFRGQGAFEITGNVTFGTYDGQLIQIQSLILDSVHQSAINGPAMILVNHSFVWRRGTINGLDNFVTQYGSHATFEPGASKRISSTNWDVLGSVAGNSFANIELSEGASISVEPQGTWTQESGGSVRPGLNGNDGFHVVGDFVKLGEGAFVVSTSFDCAGTMNLVEGVLTVQGDFNLFDSGLITGGGTAAVHNNVRLILVGADSATMSGTIRPDLDGLPARMAINGLVDLAPAFRLELDVSLNGDIPTESLNFNTGGQVLDGTLELHVWNFPDPPIEFRVISMVDGSGEIEVTEGGVFTDIIQDGSGVLLVKN